MAIKRVVIPYCPRDVFKPFHDRTQRFAIGVAHRRCGKTVACINDKVRKAILSPKEMYRAGYIAPYLKQAKDVAWEYLKRYSRPLWGQPPNESELYVTLLGGQRIRIYGADNADALRGGFFDDVTLDEYADMAPSVWGSIIRPMLADRQGSATFIGTPKGRNSFFDIWERAQVDPDWFSFMLRASETGLLAESELIAARQDMTPEQFLQEFECSFEAAILGAYFGKEVAQAERDGRIKDYIEIEPEFPVHTAWDIGNSDHMAIWCWQAINGEVRVVDYVSQYGLFMDKYCAELDAKGYHGIDYVPHDARVKSVETGRTRLETLISLGRKPELVADHKVMDGINAARKTFPQVYFDGTNCKDGIEALRQYRAEYDEKTRAFKDTPKKDWATHPADAFRYLCMAWRAEAKPDKPEPKPLFKQIDEITMSEWHEMDKVRPGQREAL